MRYIKLLLLPCLALMLGSCEKDPVTVTPTDNIDQLISKNPNLSLFKAALIKTNLTTFTQGPGPFTVYAPTNAAFNLAGINTEADLDALNATNPLTLVTLITNHLGSGKRTSYEIPAGPNGTIVSINGFTNYTTVTAAGVAYINGGMISSLNNNASNGVMHIIDRVLLPISSNTLLTLAANPNYSRFLQAINKTASTTFFPQATPGTVTVFAPTNAAMIAAGYDSTTIANLTPAGITTLTGIVRYHSVPGRIFTPDMKDGNLRTATTANVVISGGATKVKGINNATPLNILMGNIQTTNGVIHAIDGVLRP